MEIGGKILNNTTFGQLIEKLLYLTNQKKGTLAKELGYDISYISKWINTKNLPSQKNINQVCKVTAQFIVRSLNDGTRQEFLDYFELNDDIYNDEDIKRYIERGLKESYTVTAEMKNMSIYRDTYSEEHSNSVTHINPSLRKAYLNNDAEVFFKKNGKLDIIISANLYNLNKDDKKAISLMKKTFHNMEPNKAIRIRFLMGFDRNSKDIIYNTILVINMATTYPDIDFKVYNCEVDPNAIISVIKDNTFHSAVFAKDKRCLFTTMSKEKNVVDEMYYSLSDMLRNQGVKVFEEIEPLKMIKNQKYIQYTMGSDLRWLIGSINELLMPEDLFMEIGKMAFGDNLEIMDELQKINLFLQNVTYTSNLKILIYESELKRYISTGELRFFNIPVTLSFKQRERHIEYIENILKESDKVNIRLVEDDFVEEFSHNVNPSLYLSRNIKMTTVHPSEEVNNYLIIRDNEFEDICSNLFDLLWNKKEDVVIKEKEEVIHRISKSRIYAKLINEKFN